MRKVNLISVVVFVLVFLIGVNGYSQNDPGTPTAGEVETPFVIDSEDSSNNPTTNDESSIPIESPDVPTITTEEIAEDSGETLPVEIDGEAFNLNNTQDGNSKTNIGSSVGVQNTQTSTVRSGGLEVALLVIALFVVGGFYYYNRKQRQNKSKLSTNEKKLKY
ncbi:hypothetical protein HC766_03505 [Candidatus Gracilibacteria bacterium]|nr:hypothetical protein [Candidatus Gracilibacteria bacterium]NJS41414.1 hypothetical protein [Candidatus Gracilibacteria bacterium]